MPRCGIQKPIGTESVWKDRIGRVRTKIKVEQPNIWEDKEVYLYKKYNKDSNLKGYVIIHLDNNPYNFDKDNLIKIKKEIFLLMLNNRMLFDDRELNKVSILTATNMYECKKRRK